MINLSKLSTDPPKGIKKEQAEKQVLKMKEQLFDLQNRLYAEKKHSLLIILQGMDAAGKDGTIRHVFSSIDPQGCNVKSFKKPTEEEAGHDFLWRVHPHTPAKGMISIFNRSHYEDILVPSVHKLLDKKTIKRRYDIINDFEESLRENDTIIIKLFLHLSRKEQKQRMRERLSKPHKKWKYQPDDLKEGKLWDDYMDVYEMILNECSEKIPWNIVPADHRWYRNYFVARKIVETLQGLKMEFPG
jgi:PPK2 family polyphosphate:nucleotide phosphotransferase